MLCTVDQPVVGGENSSSEFYSTSSPGTEIHSEVSQTTVDDTTTSSFDTLELPERQSCADAFPGKITADQTGRPVTNAGPCLEVRKAVAAAVAAKARRLAMAKATRWSPKRSRRCTLSDAQRPSPRLQPSVPRVPWRELNKENIDPKSLPSQSSPSVFAFGGVGGGGGGVLGGARVRRAQSIAQPTRKKRLLSEASSSSLNSSRQCAKLSGGGGGNGESGNNFKVKKGWENSREPLRVLWTREGNTGPAPPVFLRALRSL